jgi:uncharacterized Zn-binding protein involved in type VI secretion
MIKKYLSIITLLFSFLIPGNWIVYASKPAARMGDMTAHGGSIVAGCPTVLIGGMPAARMGDMHVCPMLNPGFPPVPHVGGPISQGSPTVLIGGMPAARLGDMCVCVGPPDVIVMGCMTVLIGDGGMSKTDDSLRHDLTETEENELPIPPAVFVLNQNHPNPFNPSTRITYQLPIAGEVELSVFNLLGQKVATLVHQRQAAGTFYVEWNAAGFSSGIYHCILRAGEFRQVKKMVLIR